MPYTIYNLDTAQANPTVSGVEILSLFDYTQSEREAQIVTFSHPSLMFLLTQMTLYLTTNSQI